MGRMGRKRQKMFDLSGKCVLVTGSSGSLGHVIAHSFAAAGADVACHYFKNRDAAEETAKAIGELGRKSVSICGDLTITEEAERVIDETVEKLGNLHVLVNNAGVSKQGLFIRQGPELIGEVLKNNLESMFFISKAAARVMAKNRWGRLIHLGSVVTYMGSTAQSAYAASKAGAMGMSRAIARELGGRNITSNVVAPGLIDTGMTDAMSDERRKVLMPFIAVGRTGTAEEVAATCVFLASEEASYITGTVIHVNGGLYM